MKTLTIKDLLPQGEQTTTIRSLSREELRRISGGRSYAVGMLNGDENNLVTFDIDKWNFDQFARGNL